MLTLSIIRPMVVSVESKSSFLNILSVGKSFPWQLLTTINKQPIQAYNCSLPNHMFDIFYIPNWYKGLNFGPPVMGRVSDFQSRVDSLLPIHCTPHLQHLTNCFVFVCHFAHSNKWLLAIGCGCIGCFLFLFSPLIVK